MTPSPRARTRRKRVFLAALAVTVVAFGLALILRGQEDGSSPLLTSAYTILGGVSGLGAAYLLVIGPILEWQQRRKDRQARRHPS